MGILSVQKRWQSLLLAAALIVTSVTTALTNSAFATAGDIQPWQTATNGLPEDKVVEGTVELNGYIYAFGGERNTTNPIPSASVYYSHLDSSGQPGIWSSTTSLPEILVYTTGLTKNGYVYAFGLDGYYHEKLYYAHQNTDGTLGAWAALSTPENDRTLASSVVVNDYVYVIGGSLNGDIYNPTPPVYYAHLNSDGSIGPWIPTTATFPNVVAVPNVVTSNGYIYAIGGSKDGADDTPAAYTSVYYTHVNSNGSIDPWSTTTNLPQPTLLSASVVANGYIYTMGGSPDAHGDTARDSVVFSHINSDGSLNSWQTSEHPLPVHVTGTSALSTAGTIYVIGGMGDGYSNTNSSNVYFTSLTPQTIAAPTGLTATTPTNQKPALSWTGVTGATSYTIYRNGTSVGTSTSASFTDSALAADSNYSYTVTATNGSLTSVQSAPFTVLYDATVPTATNGTISGWLVLHWGNPTISANVSDNLSGVTGGEYYIDTDPGKGNGTPMAYSSGKINATVTISSGTNGLHTIYMRSKDAAGNWSATTSVQYLYLL